MADETTDPSPAQTPPVPVIVTMTTPQDTPPQAWAQPDQLSVTLPAKGSPKCPTCKNALEVYVGENVHKLATAWCAVCGARHKVV